MFLTRLMEGKSDGRALKHTVQMLMPRSAIFVRGETAHLDEMKRFVLVGTLCRGHFFFLTLRTGGIAAAACACTGRWSNCGRFVRGADVCGMASGLASSNSQVAGKQNGKTRRHFLLLSFFFPNRFWTTTKLRMYPPELRLSRFRTSKNDVFCLLQVTTRLRKARTEQYSLASLL